MAIPAKPNAAEEDAEKKFLRVDGTSSFELEALMALIFGLPFFTLFALLKEKAFV